MKKADSKPEGRYAILGDKIRRTTDSMQVARALLARNQDATLYVRCRAPKCAPPENLPTRGK